MASTLAEGFFTTDPPRKPLASPVKPCTSLIVNEFVIILFSTVKENEVKGFIKKEFHFHPMFSTSQGPVD